MDFVATVPEILEVNLPDVIEKGDDVTLAAVAVGAGDLSYQWYRDGVAIEGETGASLLFPAISASSNGDYTVVVTNLEGMAESAVSRLQVPLVPAVGGIQTVAAFAGSPLELAGYTINNQLTHEDGTATALSWTVLLPEGWSVRAVTGPGASMLPTDGTTSLAEWQWTSPGADPIEFSYELVPADADRGRFQIATLIDGTIDGEAVESMAMPDPLYLRRLGNDRHSADLDGDSRLGLSELLRVIELYNTRNGTNRTGRYRVSLGSADMFNPDAETAAGQPAGFARFHTADTDQDASLSLSELLRVIELYNTRSGTSRTGAYRVAEGTVDGFAAVSGGE
jgi:hypothetical protein